MKAPHLQHPRRQRGIVLFIALIVLVAMTLAGIGMVRSVDTTNVIAGNLAFKQGTVQGADLGINAAVLWLQSKTGQGALQNDDTANGHFSSRTTPVNWTDTANWANQKCVNAGCAADAATGNIVSYVIHRMCTESNTAYNGVKAGNQNQCAIYNSSNPGGSSGRSDWESSRVFEQRFLASGAAGTNINVYFRITTRVRGPRDTLSIVQSMVMLPE